MFLMSKRSTLLEIANDTLRMYKSHLFEKSKSHSSNIDDFSREPPYFGIDLIRCIGPSVSWDERISFLKFAKTFVKTSLFSSEKDSNLRGQCLVKLANANKVAIANELMNSTEGNLQDKIGMNQGIISIYRDKASAETFIETNSAVGESAKFLSAEEAIDFEPRLKFVNIQPLYFVLRPDDQVASCASFVRYLIRKLQSNHISYETKLGKVEKIERLNENIREGTKRFRIKTAEGDFCYYDHIVLANGVNAPLLAAQIGASDYCPTFPLRGFSLTTSINAIEGSKQNVLRTGLSLDKMYCTSVTSSSARLVGFGEIVGFPWHSDGFLTAGPRVIKRYANMLFPDGSNNEILECFRPLSPDDIPIAGAVKSIPGLYIHTGHGSLGMFLRSNSR